MIELDRTITSLEASAPLVIQDSERTTPRYVVEGELARGGLGRILRAYDQVLGRAVAVKELIVATPMLRARLEQEASITARLQHPAIIPVYDVGAWSTGNPFYVMKLVSGARTLKQLVAETPRLVERLAIVRHVAAVADAMAHAHDLGIIHRDLKPSNVLVGPYGETLVIDWGVAKNLATRNRCDGDGASSPAASPELTQAGTILGTPQFMAPEQARGEPVDARADIYALGAMLYYVIAGRGPFVGETTAEVLERLTTTPPPALATLQPRAPRALVAIVQHAMARAASDRYAHIHEVAADLQRWHAKAGGGGRCQSSRAGGRRILRSSAGTSRRACGSIAR